MYPLDQWDDIFSKRCSPANFSIIFSWCYRLIFYIVKANAFRYWYYANILFGNLIVYADPVERVPRDTLITYKTFSIQWENVFAGTSLVQSTLFFFLRGIRNPSR